MAFTDTFFLLTIFLIDLTKSFLPIPILIAESKRMLTPRESAY